MQPNNPYTKYSGSKQVKHYLFGSVCCIIAFSFFPLPSGAQCPTATELYSKMITVETADDDMDIKLQQAFALKKQFESCGLEKDSVYARILHKIGVYEYNSTGEINQAIQNTLLSVRINTSGKKNASRQFAVNSYANLGYYYHDLFLYTKAAEYLDSCILLGSAYPQCKNFVADARTARCHIFFKMGDYEKDIREATLGLSSTGEVLDSLRTAELVLERAQAYGAQSKIDKETADLNYALLLLANSEIYPVLANAYRYKGDICADQGLSKQAIEFYKKAISFRIKTDSMSDVAMDYNDLGYLLRTKIGDLKEAGKYFTLAYQTALQANNTAVCALARDNLSQLSFDHKQYEDALKQSYQALGLLAPMYASKQITSNPPYKNLEDVDQKNLLDLLENKVKCLIYLYKQTNKKQFLQSSVATALLADTVITNLRHRQLDEQSKLYWRTETRKFFTNVLEACYLSNDPALAFYFMEKSRAVLLNDKLNEIGASRNLPPGEEARQEMLLINIVEQQQKLSALSDTSKQYHEIQLKLLTAREDFEHYIKSLEQKYPAYYQYKYADEVPSLATVQQYLGRNNQSFVHYFMGDTVTYILAITPNSTKLTRLLQKDFNRDQLFNFLQLCSDKENLNNHYSDFATLSNSIYKSLFQSLQVPKGRVIICADNMVIPFEALCTDTQGRHFLIYDYTFSYVYSARYLIQQFSNAKASGNFLGFAPVSFAAGLGVPDLKNAADALKASSAYYSSEKLFTNKNASRSNFFHYTASYSVVSIFSHARADTTGNEPVLFMQDSLIHLSELQLLNNPATRLVLLSACQTNIGKTAAGEGIYSLARGFASAGIPSVAATLWKADEQTIYSISEKFNEYLSQGMNKDEALQKAKLYFIKNSSSEKTLPYYWANMIIIGNAEPITLSADDHRWWWIAGIGIIAFVFVLVIAKKRRKHKN